VRIFNELEVDELAFLDIGASRQGRGPDFKLLHEIADECFMPLAYGGGIRDVDTAGAVLEIGFEKIVLNTAPLQNPDLVPALAGRFGSQAVIAAIDVRRDILGRNHVTGLSGTRRFKHRPVDWAREMQERGAGEILLTSIDREGTWNGFDVELIRSVTDAVSIPVIAHGGAGSVEHIGQAVHQGHASAVGLGSLVVYQRKGMGVLVNFPDPGRLKAILSP